MWSFRSEPLRGIRGQRFFVDLDARPASYAEILRAWQDDAAFRSSFQAQLADAPYAAFRWETPPVTDNTITCPFEFVLLDSPGLASHPDPRPFAERFAAACEEGIVVFSNLGGDAIMVVPSLRRRWRHIARQLLGDDMAFDFDMLIDKAPGTDTPTPFHQDMAYWVDLPDHRAGSCWIALDEATVDNGCMWFAPGSHRLPLRQHRWRGKKAAVL